MRRLLTILFIFLASTFFAPSLHAEIEGGADRHELGFWIGASNPWPSTELADLLDSTVSGGFFYRLNWPWVFHTELGFSYASYLSRTTQKMSILPVYGALAYRLPLPYRLQVFLKAGGGYASVNIRPQDINTVDTLAYGGLEVSVLASRKFRIGTRIDYFRVNETHLQTPKEQTYYTYYYLAYRPEGLSYDPRFFENYQFETKNGHFFNISIMLSFYM